jgi:hypothetical protein
MDNLGYKEGNKLLLNIMNLIISLCVGSVIFLFGALFESKKDNKVMKSPKRIEPSYTITIKDGKTDTLFIYKKEK